MTDTHKIKTVIEPFVRDWLSTQFPGHVFQEKPVQLTSGESYDFDAVAEDSSVIAAILCNRAKTRTGRDNTGGVRKALNDVCYLKAVPARVEKVMVFTDDGFCQLVRSRASRLGMEGIKTMVCKLPAHLEALGRKILDDASHEQRAAV